MTVQWTKKKIRLTVKRVLGLGIGIILFNSVSSWFGKINRSMENQNSIMSKWGQKSITQYVDFFYPVMACRQGGEQQTVLESVVEKACLESFPVGYYLRQEKQMYQYATQMENELPAEIQEILAKETQGNGTDKEEESETQRANRVLEQFGTDSVQEAGSETVVAAPPVEQAQGGVEYTAEMLNYDFLINHFYTVDSTTNISAEKLNADKLLKKDMTIKGDNTKPQILIYHTHSQEEFVDSVAGDESTTIVGVGDYLAQILHEKYGFNVIHNKTAYDLIDGKLDRNKAYSLALPDIQEILKENPSIEVVIDLHRDGIEGQKLVTDINGKPTAKIMFFNGLSYTSKNGAIDYLKNPYIEDNLAFSLQLQLAAAKYYPGATRKIYLKGYRYNLHVCPKALLVESGAQNNTLEEEKNAMDVLADVLYRVLSGS